MDARLVPDPGYVSACLHFFPDGNAPVAQVDRALDHDERT